MKRTDIKIVLSLHDIEKEVFRHCYYVGSARRESGTPIKLATDIQASIDDREEIEKHISVGIDEIVRLISRYFSTCSRGLCDDEEHAGYQTVTLSLTPPYNFPTRLNETLRSKIEHYIIMRTVNLWLQQMMPGEAVIPAGEIEKAISELRELMVCRNSPRRVKNKPDTNIVI